jgi:outer membrane protein assembly factor BamB
VGGQERSKHPLENPAPQERQPLLLPDRSQRPHLFEGTLFLQAEQNGKKSSLLAYDKATGELKWQQPRPDAIFAHSTPILATVGGKPQLIISHSNRLEGVDPHDGKQLWSVENNGETASPAFGNNLVYVDTGRGGGGICAELSTSRPRSMSPLCMP